MAVERRKVLRYRRAIYHHPRGKKVPEDFPTLEDNIHAAHSKITTSARRLVAFEGGFTLQMRYARKRRNAGTLLHLAAYTEREPTSIVPGVRGSTDDAPLSTAPPPAGAEYMDGDLLLLVSGNDVVVCASSLHDHKFHQYCASMFNVAEIDPTATMFELAAVANANKLEIIENEGIKAITLDATMFAASADNVSRRSIRRTLNAGMLEVFRALFGKDAEFDEIRSKENLSAQLVIKFDSRRKGGELGQERIVNLAKRLIDEPGNGFRIQTRANTTFGHDEIVLQKTVTIRAEGKTVQRDAAFAELVNYMEELRNAGHLEQ